MIGIGATLLATGLGSDGGPQGLRGLRYSRSALLEVVVATETEILFSSFAFWVQTWGWEPVGVPTSFFCDCRLHGGVGAATLMVVSRESPQNFSPLTRTPVAKKRYVATAASARHTTMRMYHL